ncbi:MAG: alcohol dehydrogenase [Myxococcaceae bacterium]|nr:alcohol dehydrogenase [Myxococcaceae bacterium]
MMRAVEIKQHGGPEQLTLTSLPIPEPSACQVLLWVHAFGVNRAETYMRSGAWGEVARITGIECVGEVVLDPSERLHRGQKVFALMGGMGRTINGSYAEYVCVPASNVVPIESSLSWATLAAIPESYATAFSCVDANLSVEAGQTLLVRGGTSALGQAAIELALARGARVYATTRSEQRLALLRELGAEPVLDQPELAQELRCRCHAGVDAVLDLVGSSTVFDSLAATRRGGRVCLAGFLGGHQPIAALDPVLQLPSGVHLSVFASFMLGTPGYELTQIPFQRIVQDVERGQLRAAAASTFTLEQTASAHARMESNTALGKLVVTVSEAARREVSSRC